jgi:hypothetical protein
LFQSSPARVAGASRVGRYSQFYPIFGAAVKLVSPGFAGEAAGSSSHFPASDILVPQQAQVPIIARRPFFISVRVGASISCLARQRTQYPVMAAS